jgi:arylsulfatase A-like enzyme
MNIIFYSHLKTFLKSLLLFPVIVACNNKQQKAPNILIVFPDQFRGHAPGFMGIEPGITPNIDAFANESLVLTSAVSNYPLSSPFRAMLMTGKYPVSNGVTDNCMFNTSPDIYLRKSDTTWSDVLKERGYSLGYIGKWHLETPQKPYITASNYNNEWTPPDRRHGFGFWYGYNTLDNHNNPIYWNTEATREEFTQLHQWSPEVETDVAIRFIKNEDGKYRDPDKPWALVVSMNPPHPPYDHVPQKYLDTYDSIPDEKIFSYPNIPPSDSLWGAYYRKHARNYYAQITGVDDNFGKILKVLHDSGMEKNTIVIFTSDHGDCIGIHNERAKNTFYEESMVIPFIIRWPDHIRPTKDNLLISVPDFYPTLLGLSGIRNKIPKGVMGNDYSEIFLTGKGNRPSSQLFMCRPFNNLGIRGVRTNTHTMVINKLPDGSENTILFDNNNDPFQLNNIADKEPETISYLISELQKWLLTTNDPWKINSK